MLLWRELWDIKWNIKKWSDTEYHMCSSHQMTALNLGTTTPGLHLITPEFPPLAKSA